MAQLSENDFIYQDLYAWIDLVPLSRPKKDFKRDFSDGVLAAEIIKYYLPQLVEIHNYTPALATNKKISNWKTLNRKVLGRLGCVLNDSAVHSIVSATPGAAENFLIILREHIEHYISHLATNNHQGSAHGDKTEADQDMVNYYQLQQQPMYQQQQLPLYHQQQQQLYQQQQQLFQQQQQLYQQQQLQAGTKEKLLQDEVSLKHQRKVYAARKLNNQSGVSQVKPSSTNQSGVSQVKPPPSNHYRVPVVQSVTQEQSVVDEKDEAIKLLEAKVRRLEHLVELKDIRIEDLQARLSQLSTATKQPRV